MAGLVPAIHVFAITKEVVDARVRPGHDDVERLPERRLTTSAAR
jgi:hypothetical protein